MCIGIYALLFAVTVAQRNYYPVVTSMIVTEAVRINEGDIDISGVLSKPAWITSTVCQYAGMAVSIETPSGWKRVNIEFYDQPENAPVTRNPGDSVFGVWRIKSGTDIAKNIRLDIEHNCGELPFVRLKGKPVHLVKALSVIYLTI